MKMPVPDDRWTALGTTIIYTTNMAAPPPTLLGSILEVAAGGRPRRTREIRRGLIHYF